MRSEFEKLTNLRFELVLTAAHSNMMKHIDKLEILNNYGTES